MTNRLFIAYNLNGAIKDLIDEQRKKIFPENKERWIEKNNLHATIKFLGDTDEKLIENINYSLDRIASEFPKVNCFLKGFGFFERQNGGILFVDFEADENFYEIARKVEIEMEKLGFDKERKNLKQHITILRYKNNIEWKIKDRLKSYKFENISFELDSMSLMKSDLKPNGAVYTELKKFYLAKKISDNFLT